MTPSVRDDVVGVRAGWGPRAETAEACTKRLARMIAALAPLHPVYQHLGWASEGFAGRTRQIPSQPGLDLIVKLLAPVRSFDREQRRFVVDGFGFRISAANIRQDPLGIDIVLDMRVGRRREDRHGDENFILLTTNTNDTALLLALKPTLLALVDAWEPEGAVLFSSRFLALAQSSGEPQSYYRGSWAAYVAGGDAAGIEPPPGATAVVIPDRGLLLMATEGVFSWDDLPTVGIAMQIHAALANA